MQNTFGSQLRATREQAGATLGQLARHLGVSVPYLSDVEVGRRAPLALDKAQAAAEFLKAPGLLKVAAMCRDAISFDGLCEAQRAHVVRLVLRFRKENKMNTLVPCEHHDVRPDPKEGGHLCHDCKSHVVFEHQLNREAP